MRWCRSQISVVVAGVALSLMIGALQSRVRSDDRDDPAGSPPADIKNVAPGKSDLHRLLDKSAGQYAMYADAETPEPSKLRCVLRWANQSRGSVDGATYIWTDRGRPIAAVCCYPWYSDLCDNFQSLARAPIRAERDGKIAWRPKTPGVSFQKVPDAPIPAGTRTLPGYGR